MAIDMDLETVLRAPALEMPPYPAKVITLANGSRMVVRQAAREDVPVLLQAVRPTLDITRDYYDIVACSDCWWYRYACRKSIALGGVALRVVCQWAYDKNIGISYHTLAIDRGLRVGAHLFASKMEYHVEYLGQQEVWITAESPIGFRRWMIEYGLIEQKDVQHELGGATSFKLTRDLYFETKPRLVAGMRPVPPALLDKAMQAVVVADEQTISEKICGVKGR